MVIETVGLAVAQAVISRLSGEGALKLFSGHQDRAAMEKAFESAWAATLETHRAVLSSYDVNEAFWKYEGAREIERILLPGRGPDGRVLARACIRSLPGGGRGVSSDPLVVPFDDFIDHLTEELGRHGPFRTRLSEVAATRSDGAGPADESEFLEWIVGRFEFLQTAGIGTAQHLQLPLRNVFVEPQGVREQRGGVKWSTRAEELRALLEERLRNAEISHEEYEAHLDRLVLEEGSANPVHEENVAVAEIIRQSDRAVVLGDPGTGKTTLLRYLALQHAQALLNRDEIVSPQLGEARLPLYVRAGDFARSQQRDAGVRAFIVPFLAMTLQCPVEAAKLDGLIDRWLRAGRALVLIDGLDEVTTAQDRAAVVESIGNFVAAQQPRGNRFICTSRISGYPAAPLPPEFQAVRLLEMNDASIEQFLNQYVPAIEYAEASNKSSAIARQDAEKTVQDLLDAFTTSPGVRRLATNPLLLTALLLVHRTHGALPERRVDAYKAVTDALGHTWRIKQGVPELELPDERRLTQWLTRLADWMHSHRPEGSATVRDLLEQWGPLWSKLQREQWDPQVLGDADPAATDVGSAILTFVAQVEQHTGLLVERAPRRWGFPHLTFEEFYAARALAFDGRASDRAARIRERLHDARYDEPILLALGLLGRDQPEELEQVFEAAILARGEDGDSLGLSPSEREDLLGRDFRFALRALADDVPASPHVIDDLLKQAIDEALDPDSRARFTRYGRELLDRVNDLAGVSAGARAAQLLAEQVADEPFTDSEQRQRFLAVASRCPLHPSLAKKLIEMAATSRDPAVAIDAAKLLASAVELPAAVLERLTELIGSENPSFAVDATRVLAEVGDLPAAVLERLTELIGSDNLDAAAGAAQLLADVGELPAAVLERLTELIAGDSFDAATTAEQLLAGVGELPTAVLERLTELIGSDDIVGAINAGQLLERAVGLPGPILERLTELINGNDALAAIGARDVLAGVGELPTAVLERLTELINSDSLVAPINAAYVLAQAGDLPAGVLERLTDLSGSENPDTAIYAAQVLAASGRLPAAAVGRLIEIIGSDNLDAAASAAQLLAEVGELPAAGLERLTEIIGSENPGAAGNAKRVLGSVGPLSTVVLGRLTEIIGSENPGVAVNAVQLLSAVGELPAVALARLIEIIGSENPDAAVNAARVLAEVSDLPATVLERLIEIMGSDNVDAAAGAAQLLAEVGELPDSYIQPLLGYASSDANWSARQSVVTSIAAQNPSKLIVDGLLQRLRDQDNDVRKAAGNGLANLANDYPEWRDQIADALHAAAHGAFSDEDRFERRAAADYAYDALWRLTELEGSSVATA